MSDLILARLKALEINAAVTLEIAADLRKELQKQGRTSAILSQKQKDKLIINRKKRINGKSNN